MAAFKNLCRLTQKIYYMCDDGDVAGLPDDPYLDSIDEDDIDIMSTIVARISNMHIAVVHQNTTFG